MFLYLLLYSEFQFIALLSLPYEGRWPGECRVGGVKAYHYCGTKANLSPLSRQRRQLPSEGSLGNAKSQFANKSFYLLTK